MRKILLIIVLVMLIGCNRDKKPKVVRHVDRLEFLKEWNPLQYEVESHGCKTYMEYMDKINKELKDWPFPNANGHFTIMRSSDPIPPDTIVDGIGYRRD